MANPTQCTPIQCTPIQARPFAATVTRRSFPVGAILARALVATGLALVTTIPSFARDAEVGVESRACPGKVTSSLTVLVAEPKELDLSPFEELTPSEALDLVERDWAGRLPEKTAELHERMVATIELCARLDFIEMRTDDIRALIDDSGCASLTELLRGETSSQGTERASEKGTHTIPPWGYVTCRDGSQCHSACPSACWNAQLNSYTGQDHYLFLNDSGSVQTCQDWGKVNGYRTCKTGVLWWMMRLGSATRTCSCV